MRQTYLKVYTRDGYYITYGSTEEGGVNMSSREVHTYKRGDYETIELTEQELTRLDKSQGQDYVLCHTPLANIIKETLP